MRFMKAPGPERGGRAFNLKKTAAVFFALFYFLNPRPVLADGVTVLAMGDSTTAGTPAFRSPVETPPKGQGNPESQYTYWLAKQIPGWTFLNRGVNGDRIEEIIIRLRKDLKDIKPKIVILLAGINDLYQGGSTERVTSNLKSLYDLAEKSGAKVVVCTILPYDAASPEILDRIREVNGWIRGYAAVKKYVFCDTYAAVENPQKPGKLVSSPDGLHPDAASYRKMGESLAEVFKKEFQEEFRGR